MVLVTIIMNTAVVLGALLVALLAAQFAVGLRPLVSHVWARMNEPEWPAPAPRRRITVAVCGNCGTVEIVNGACAQCAGRSWAHLFSYAVAERARGGAR